MEDLPVCRHWVALRSLIVDNNGDFENKWEGWKMRGDVLISPDDLRIRSPQLRALFFQHGLKKRVFSKGVLPRSDARQMQLF